MATQRVGVYRSYYGKIPMDGSGNPIPKKQWPRRRSCSWVVRWYGEDGKRYSRSFPSKREAEHFAEEKQQEVRDGRGDPPERVTLREFHTEHAKLMRGNVKPATLAMHLATLKMLAGRLGWRRTIDKVSSRDIEGYRAARLKTGIRAQTANKEIKVLRRCFNLAIRRGYLRAGSNPCVGLPMIKTTPKLIAYCPPEEFRAILRRANDVLWQALLLTIYTTGLRPREAMNLTWADVDFEREQLHVARKDAGELVQAWEPKDYEIRTIPLPEQAINALTALQSLAPDGCPYAFMDAGRWDYRRQAVADGRWREGQDLMNNVLRKFKTRCRQAGVKEYTLHDLRRSCITNWALHLPIHVVQKLAGHSDIKTTQTYYLFVRKEDIARAQQVQAKLLGNVHVPGATDQLLTNSAQKRHFPGQRGCPPKS